MAHTVSLLLKARQTERVPFIWFWPNAAPAALIMTHDVEAAAGRDFSAQLMDIDDSYGIKSAFQVVPEMRYDAHAEFLDVFRRRGFEVNDHDLNHDGDLFQNKEDLARKGFAPERCIATRIGMRRLTFHMTCLFQMWLIWSRNEAVAAR
jgi:hypothetical protein